MCSMLHTVFPCGWCTTGILDIVHCHRWLTDGWSHKIRSQIMFVCVITQSNLHSSDGSMYLRSMHYMYYVPVQAILHYMFRQYYASLKQPLLCILCRPDIGPISQCHLDVQMLAVHIGPISQ